MDFELLRGKFTTSDVKQLNPLVLAFIGDAVYELFVRSYLVDKNRDLQVHKLHVKAIDFVKAKAQSDTLKSIEDMFTDEEMAIYKRGRNAKSYTTPKNADVRDYRIATGFEALLGYLYISDKIDRLNEILDTIINMKTTMSGGK